MTSKSVFIRKSLLLGKPIPFTHDNLTEAVKVMMETRKKIGQGELNPNKGKDLYILGHAELKKPWLLLTDRFQDENQMREFQDNHNVRIFNRIATLETIGEISEMYRTESVAKVKDFIYIHVKPNSKVYKTQIAKFHQDVKDNKGNKKAIKSEYYRLMEEVTNKPITVDFYNDESELRKVNWSSIAELVSAIESEDENESVYAPSLDYEIKGIQGASTGRNFKDFQELVNWYHKINNSKY